MIYLALGSNLSGDFANSQQLVSAAIDNLPLCGAQVVARAPLYRSAAVGPKIDGQGQGDYINTVVAVRSVTPATALLRRLHVLEAAFGRERRVPWGPRTLDIDIVSYHDEIHTHMAQIPHPRLGARAFVLYPLRDIAPGWRHPLSGTKIDTLIHRLPTAARRGLVKLSGL
jgi:2-amino-4-hydroxy-6-hydroxymethyldihydropteridine diphosphokinase